DDDLSALEININNRTDEDFEDVPIYIQINKENLIGDVLSMNYFDQNGATDGVILNKVDSNDNFNRYSFTVHTLNRNDKPGFKAKFILKGASVPEYLVQTNRKGLSLEEYVLKDTFSWVYMFFGFFAGAIFCGIWGALTFYLYIKPTTEKAANEVYK